VNVRTMERTKGIQCCIQQILNIICSKFLGERINNISRTGKQRNLHVRIKLLI